MTMNKYKFTFVNYVSARHEKYNHKQSSTYIPDGRPFNITSGDNSYTGYMSKDAFLVCQYLLIKQLMIQLQFQHNLQSIFCLYISEKRIIQYSRGGGPGDDVINMAGRLPCSRKFLNRNS